jgi:hypothetical protein
VGSVGRLYSCASRPLSVGSRGRVPKSQVLPSSSYSRVRWFRPVSRWDNTELLMIQTARINTKLQLKASAVPTPLLWLAVLWPSHEKRNAPPLRVTIRPGLETVLASQPVRSFVPVSPVLFNFSKIMFFFLNHSSCCCNFDRAHEVL